MKQITPAALPDWTASVVHHQTADFLSNTHPAFGETVTITLRAASAAPLSQVVLQSLPNGEQQLTEMRKVSADGGFQYWQASLLLIERLNTYFFVLSGEGGIYFLDALGPQQDIPLRHSSFKLLTGHAPIPWFEHAVFYQIFPDRFANGDPSNDPKGEVDPVSGARRDTYPWAQPAAASSRMQIPFYGGDLKGVEEHLDYLKDLGINAIYLNPVFDAWTNHRYDVRDYFKVDPTLGGDEALASLSGALKRLGMRYVLDIVPNHCGFGHPWFLKARQDPRSEEASYFYLNQGSAEYATWMGVPSLPKLNYASEGLKKRIYGPEGVFSYWLKPPFDADGWRVDVGNMLGRHQTDDYSQEVIQGIRASVKQTKPDAYLFGENFFEASSQLQGDQWDGVMNYMGFSNPLLAWLKPQRMGAIGYSGRLESHQRWQTATLVKAWMDHLAAIPWSITLQQYNLLSGHDTPRVKTILEADPDLLRLAYVALFAFPGIPSVYYGDEIGMEDLETFGPRACMLWDEKDWDLDFLAFMKDLIKLRKTNKAMTKGGFQILHWEEDLLIFQRELAGEQVLVSLCRAENAAQSREIAVPEAGILDGSFESLWGSQRLEVKEKLLQMPIIHKGGAVYLRKR